jgi:predicted NBD/HSP70 family sugar kinase
MEDEVINRGNFLEVIDVESAIYREWMRDLGGGDGNGGGLRFFEAREKCLMFGPGAGLVVGVSLGTTSLRAGLFDANGCMYHEYKGPPKPNQLDLPPTQVLDRVRHGVAKVLGPAFENDSLLVNGKLPFRGVAVAWPAPVNRNKCPVGHALSHRSWRRDDTPLTRRVSRRLGLDVEYCHAINDAWAASIGVAFDRTREPRHLELNHPELTIVIRLAGGIGAASIVIEPPQGEESGKGTMSGFAASILLGGNDAHAGELGHVRVPPSTILERNEDGRPEELEELRPCRCSCTSADDTTPHHLEAYASRRALAQRVDSTRSEEQVVHEVLSQPHDPVHRRALEDIGILTADCMQGAVSMLNPARITLTGSLANKVVGDAFASRIEDEHRVIEEPTIDVLEGTENEYIRARGAALAVLRRQVHRRLDSLLGIPTRKEIPRQLEQGLLMLDSLPWEKEGE